MDQVDLVPHADPNTASQTQRLMKVVALKQIQGQNPSLYDPIAIDTAALQAIGWSNPEQFMAPMSSQGKMPPEMQQKIEELKNVGIKVVGEPHVVFPDPQGIFDRPGNEWLAFIEDSEGNMVGLMSREIL